MKKAWFYVILPPIVMNIGSLLLIAAVYAYKYATAPLPKPDTLTVSFGQTQFVLSIFIFLAEWFFAGLLIYSYRKSNLSLRSLFFPNTSLLKFRWLPAILFFVLFNAIFAAYIYYMAVRMPDLSYRDMKPVQSILFIVFVPLTAAFAEELIWRGHVLSRFMQDGKKPWAALLVSAASFALIHGVFLPDKLAVTFLLGLLAGAYYLRERNLLPLMFTHWFVDVWSFGLFLFR